MRFNLLNIKHFAEEADNNGIFGSAQLSDNNTGVVTSDYDSIASLQAFKEGWNAATLTSKRLPPLEEMQGLESYLSYLINYLYQQGMPQWSSTQTYFTDSFVKTNEGGKMKVWYSLIDNNTNLAPATNPQAWKEFTSGGGGGEIGDIGLAPLGIDETLNLRRYLNGQVISQSQFVPFTNKLKAASLLHPSLITTEVNWQAEVTNSVLGQCGKFVIDDNAGTIRLPKVINAQGLTDLQYLGTIKNQSLPNISGEFRVYSNNADPNVENASGAFYFDTKTSGSNNYVNAAPATATFQPKYIGINASLSSSAYQNNAPVQQEAIQYPYYIQVATGVEEELPAIREYEINTPFFFGQSMYSENVPYNASWLASNGQYNASSLYPDFWTQLMGVELNASLNVGDTIEISGKTYVKRGLSVVLSTGTYTDYDFVVNQNNQTFRLPLRNGEEDLPSDVYDGMTLQASGTAYIAPANGWFAIDKSLHANNWVQLRRLDANDAELYGKVNNYEGNDQVGGRNTIYVTKGAKVSVEYTGTGYLYYFRFIYAKGNGTLYYYVGDTIQDASLINAGAILGQLSNKADIDASNFNAAGRSYISGLDGPSNTGINLIMGASGTPYAAPANGYVSLIGNYGNAGGFLHIENVTCGMGMDSKATSASWEYVVSIRCNKGDKFAVFYNYIGTVSIFKFIYAEGEN